MESESMVEVIAESLCSVAVEVEGNVFDFSTEEALQIAEVVAGALEASGFGDLIAARSQVFLEAAQRIVTREPVDYWVENLPVKLSTQQGMAGWLKSLAGVEVAE